MVFLGNVIIIYLRSPHWTRYVITECAFDNSRSHDLIVAGDKRLWVTGVVSQHIVTSGFLCRRACYRISVGESTLNSLSLNTLNKSTTIQN